MESTRKTSNAPNRIERQLAHLKILSRLLGHELHAQNAPRITLSREEVMEVQTSIDLFIEEVLKTSKRGAGALPTAGIDVQAVAPRVN